MSPEIHIDIPGSFTLPSRYLRMRGWCFLPGATFDAVQLVLDDRVVFGRYGTLRPDVRNAYPAAPNDFTGFELSTELAPGNHPAELQFRAQDGTWHTALRTKINVAGRSKPLWSAGSFPVDLLEFQLATRPRHAPRKLRLDRIPKAKGSEMARPKVSIVTPSYNQAPFLRETLASVLSQGNVRLEYRVQDGGSTDGSLAILKEFEGQLGDWTSEKDDGQSDAIAKAFARTSGEADDLMAWLNSDDFYLPGTLACVSDYFARHPEVDVVYGNRILVDEDSNEVGRWFLPAHSDVVLKLNDFVPQETMFWRRRVWDRVGGINPSYAFAMDWDLLLRFQAAGAKIVHLPYFLAAFRLHPSQKTAAEITSMGQKEMTELRIRTHRHNLTEAEIIMNPALLAYLRRSAWLEMLWKFGLRRE